MKRSELILTLFLIITFLAAVILANKFIGKNHYETSPTNEYKEYQPPQDEVGKENMNHTTEKISNEIAPPLDNAKQRITKKDFGDFITPENSPVQPERFSGYHTGIDFEILPGEEDEEISVSAVCSGKIIYRDYVGGYGGVVVQECELKETPFTVLYGHLKLSGIAFQLGDEIKTGGKLGVLGRGYSTETDNERKHLHLAFHKGADLELRGYVPTPSQLENWLNPCDYGICR